MSLVYQHIVNLLKLVLLVVSIRCIIIQYQLSKTGYIMNRQPILIGEQTIHLRKIVSNHQTSIILVHGIGVSGDYYIQFAQQLSKDYDVYIIDLPGYGKTPKPVKVLSIRQLSDVVLQYIDQAGLSNVIIVGHSMGCQVVAHAAADRPNIFKKVVLLAPTINKNERSIFKQAFRLLQDTFHEPPIANLIVFVNYLRMGIVRYLTTTRFMMADHIETTLSSNTVPILIIRGSADKIVPLDWTRWLSSVVPFSNVAEIKDAPHLLQYKRPHRLTKLCIDFIEK